MFYAIKSINFFLLRQDVFILGQRSQNIKKVDEFPKDVESKWFLEDQSLKLELKDIMIELDKD